MRHPAGADGAGRVDFSDQTSCANPNYGLYKIHYKAYHRVTRMFSIEEMAVAAGLSQRQFGVLDEAKAISVHVTGGGKGKPRKWCISGVTKSILTGAFYRSGFDLVASGRFVCGGIIEEYTGRRKLHANLENLYQKVIGSRPVGSIRDGDDFESYKFIRSISESLIGEAVIGDLVFAITDTGYVLAETSGLKPIAIQDVAFAYCPQLRRSPVVEFSPIWCREVDGVIPESVYEEYRLAYRNAESTTRINVSLALRNGFDRLLSHRSTP